MTKALLAIASLLLLVACGGSGVQIHSDEYGELWPFTMSEGSLNCQREDQSSGRLLVTFQTNGIMYGLNGSARSFGFTDAKSIMKPGKTGADLQRLIDRGLSICRD